MSFIKSIDKALGDGFPEPRTPRQQAIVMRAQAHNHIAMDERINQRAAIHARVNAARLPDGCMWISESGRDCDGVEYQRPAYKIEAHPGYYWDEMDRINQYADGPFSLAIHLDGEQPRPWSRDRGAEAFEDGHAHVIHSSM